MRFVHCKEKLYESEGFVLRMRSNWDFPEDTFESQYGDVTYEEWLFKEKARIMSRGGDLILWKRDDGMICSTYNHDIIVGERGRVLPKRSLELLAF